MSGPPHRLAGGARNLRSIASLFAASLGLAAIVGLAACGGGPPPATFDLAQHQAAAKGLHLRRQLVVAEPTALQPLDSDHVLVRRPDGTLATLAHAQWSDRLPRLVQSRLVQAFENAGAVGRVGPFGEDALSADVTLDVEIRVFEVDVGAGQGKIELAARLVRSASGQIIAARIFQASAAGAGEGPSAVASLDQALGQALGDLTRWAAAHL
jgi:cholesterol transport system auxiliary component